MAKPSINGSIHYKSREQKAHGLLESVPFTRLSSALSFGVGTRKEQSRAYSTRTQQKFCFGDGPFPQKVLLTNAASNCKA